MSTSQGTSPGSDPQDEEYNPLLSPFGQRGELSDTQIDGIKRLLGMSSREETLKYLEDVVFKEMKDTSSRGDLKRRVGEIREGLTSLIEVVDDLQERIDTHIE